MGAPVLTVAEESDWPWISQMMADFCSIDGYPFNYTVRKEYYHTFIGDPKLGRFWQVKLDHKQVGYCILTFGFSFEYGKDAFIDEFYLNPDYRRKGVGAKVLKLIDEESKQLNIQFIHLEVEPHNSVANQLYINHGFKSSGRILMSKEIN